MFPPTTGVLGTQGQQNPSGRDAMQDVNLDDFLKLMITELQNQDPLNPMENQEILQQISQIRAIESNQRLTDTLQAVLLGQGVATAGELLGTTVKALTDGGEQIAGQVDRVSIAEGVVRIHVGQYTAKLENVAEILPEGTELPQTEDTESETDSTGT